MEGRLQGWVGSGQEKRGETCVNKEGEAEPRGQALQMPLWFADLCVQGPGETASLGTSPPKIHAFRKLLLRARCSHMKIFALVSSLILKKHPGVTLRTPRSGKILPSFRDAVVCISALLGYTRQSLAASNALLGTC